jgi:predicted Zn-ribbon and HTH transcriptional regulator
MKNIISIPVPREEDIVAANRRRESYAATRDLQALEFNEAIAKRMLLEAKSQVECETCGKKFTTETTAENSTTCPECRSSI